MYHIVYKTTNLINGKWYIGYHATSDLCDQYLGSGKNLHKAIEKYGAQNFKREILYVFPTKEEALAKEFELVNDEVVENSESYNLKLGGQGGWDHISNKAKNDQDWKKIRYGEKHSEKLRELHRTGKLIGWNNYCSGFTGKSHSLETRNKISENSAQRLSEEIINERIAQYNLIERKIGYIKKLSESWGISHTSVRRFIKNYIEK
jgi:hypothetical protein